MKSTTSRRGQTSITHLMNFSLPPRPRQHQYYGSGRGARRSANWGGRSSYHAIDKSRYEPEWLTCVILAGLTTFVDTSMLIIDSSWILKKITMRKQRMRTFIWIGIACYKFWFQRLHRKAIALSASAPPLLPEWLNVDTFSAFLASFVICSRRTTPYLYRRRNRDGKNVQYAGIAYTFPKRVPLAGIRVSKQNRYLKAGTLC